MVDFFVSLPDSDDASRARDDLLQRISDDTNLPALGSSVSQVVRVASSDHDSLRNLAHFILSDVALTQKILRLSNAVCFRTASGAPVTTVTKAIFLLGFDTIKTAALAMLLVDGMKGKRAQSVRAELAHALSASIIGRELARRSHFKDAEEAAVAALFKNLGRVLVAAHDHAMYREISDLVDNGGKSPAMAAMQVMGCSFEMLADSVLREWGMPDTIIQALTPLPSGQLKAPKSRQEWMQQVAAFSSAAATLLPKLSQSGAETARSALLNRFGSAFNLDGEKFDQLLENVAQEARVLSSSTSLPLANEVAHEGEDEEEGEHAASEPAAEAQESGLPAEFLLAAEPAPTTTIEARHASGKPVNARELLMAGVQDVTEMMASGRCKVNDLIMLVLETLYRSMGFRFATVCLKDVKSNQFRARVALGEENERRQAGFVFSAVQTRDLFHLAMENDADLLISEALSPKISDLLPAWHRQLFPDARSFIVLPLTVQKKPIGLFYADRAQPAPEGVPPDETALIKTLKGQVLAALNVRG